MSATPSSGNRRRCWPSSRRKARRSTADPQAEVNMGENATHKPRATFRRMQDSTVEDWQIIAGEFKAYAKALPDRVLSHLRLLEGDCGGFPIDRLTHSLQTAALALRAGRDEEYVVCALLH